MVKRSIKVVFDTNVWISFLIGKRISSIVQPISDGRIVMVVTEQLLTEIKLVTLRDKLSKYFPKESVKELISLLETIAENVEVKSENTICRDPKDNFLFDLISQAHADYLVTGDKDLLEHNPFKSTEIVKPAEFDRILRSRWQ